jgi:hypothetical protein
LYVCASCDLTAHLLALLLLDSLGCQLRRRKACVRIGQRT